ncbi:unnamed protein product [Notodromas monacha]|uniref:Uncharacterized protein n=1 Tax=Notodromas monacha TaxID=399045 RepID=A0A7R9BT86_9CRUS|nr:unnamed protein product [Notodromas monacha]CAG0921321.1 unnamed protein product [Notodromas monacha]
MKSERRDARTRTERQTADVIMPYQTDRNTCQYCPEDFEEASDGTFTNAVAVSTLTKDDPFPSLTSLQTSKAKDIANDVLHQIELPAGKKSFVLHVLRLWLKFALQISH